MAYEFIHQGENPMLAFLKRISQTGSILITAFVIALFITGGVYWLGTIKGIPPSHLSGDPSLITNTSLLVGILSNLGVMLWAAATASAFLGAAIQRACPRRFAFLLCSGLLTGLLGIDDLLMLHEHVFPHYLHIPEAVNYVVYMLVIGTYLLSFMKEILSETDYPLLASALLFFALSIVSNRFFSFNGTEVFIKDCLKFFGIVYWLAYFFFTSVRFARPPLPADAA